MAESQTYSATYSLIDMSHGNEGLRRISMLRIIRLCATITIGGRYIFCLFHSLLWHCECPMMGNRFKVIMWFQRIILKHWTKSRVFVCVRKHTQKKAELWRRRSICSCLFTTRLYSPAAVRCVSLVNLTKLSFHKEWEKTYDGYNNLRIKLLLSPHPKEASNSHSFFLLLILLRATLHRK